MAIDLPDSLPTGADIDAAWDAVRDAMPISPLETLEIGAHTLLCKLETENPTGSFKVRGALAALAGARERGAERIIAASAGNHGAGIAFAAGRLGVRATVAVPRNCPDIKRDKMDALGATIYVCDALGYDDTEAHARTLAARHDIPFISPFLDTAVMAGNGGTLARELLDQVPDVAAIVLPVGGGGLLAGVLAELTRVGKTHVRVVAVQSEACPAFVRSLEDDRVYDRWEGETTLAEGLEGGTGAPAVEAARAYGVTALEVPEFAIRDAMLAFHDATGGVIEGSAAVVVAARTIGALDTLPEPCVHVITGANATLPA